MSGALFFKDDSKNLYLRAEGHITANLCADLRELVFGALDRTDPPTGVYVWLENCSYMDSTFMGLLVGINKRLLKRGAHKMTLVRPSQSAKDLLAGLGVIGLVEQDQSDRAFPDDALEVGTGSRASTDLLLKAHENLMELSDENRERFGPLHSALSAAKKAESSGDEGQR